MLEKTFLDELSKLKGKECWGIVGGAGTGSIISLNIGEKYLRNNPLKNTFLSDLVRRYESEYGFMLHCPWRIDHDNYVLCGSYHSNELDGPYQEVFSQVIGNKITNIICEPPAFDLKLCFENLVSINIYCTNTGIDYDECYSFKSPIGWFEVGYNGRLSFEEFDKLPH
ncbi:hypothetical protein H0A36_14535 [Endozoicomonas sp. SM1973]|uniref:Uncharacterized protein n=1 Tax=Spartinivicinus marinus TaxID=2994442 RepID=A0A853I6G3_9GAMM|nr:hypothetical protein [Spartinivicinus marinus]MCX4028565.1 hypothetical protein [Spartinivicinus marinus]NYZ67232.1 hypothetical protein [Spartinivicinus marinus]